MNREALELAQRATEEHWDNFRILAEFIAFQKEQDAKLVELLGHSEIAETIRNS